ncbi:MAG: tetratricopeptide repeat protein [Bacteroidetes bacterium]|nr:tetratricopeptide repeat protein [Bacteroidota bacterium]
MSFQVIIAILAAVGTLAYFVPTPQELRESFVAGQNYFAARNYPKAVEQYDKVLEVENDLLTSDSVRVTLMNGELNVGVRSAAIYQKANAYRSMSMMDSAIATFRFALTRKDSPKLLVLSRYQIYDLFLQKKQYDSAIVAARELIEQHPFDEKVEQAMYDVGWAFRFLQQYDSSSAMFQLLAERYPKGLYHARALYQIGQNHLDAGHWTSAVHAFTILITAYKPESFSNTDFQSMELRVNKERRIFDAASNREEDNSNLELVSKSEFKVAEAYERMDRVDSAVGRYKYIIATYTLMPSLIEISYIRWSELIFRVNGLEPAIAVYRKAIDDNFQNKVLQARMQYKIARTYQDNKKFEPSAVEYAFFVKAYSEYAEPAEFPLENARLFSLLNFDAAKSYVNVIAASDSFAANHPGSEFMPKAMIIRGNAFLNLKRYDDARTAYTTVMETYPSSDEAPHARMQFAKSYYEQKEYTAAITEYEALAYAFSDELLTSEVQYFLGMSQFYAGNSEQAQTELMKVTPASPFYPFAFGRITKIYSALNKNDEGIAYIARVLAELPDSSEFKPYAHLTHGEVLAATGKFDEAVKEMSIVLEDSSVVENARLQARYARGALFQQTKKFAEAVTDLEYCLRSPAFQENFSGTIPSANEKLALSYIGVGRKKEAVERIVTLLGTVPSNAVRVRYLSALAELYVQLNEHQKVVEYALQVVRTDSADENTRAKAYGALSNAYGNLNNFDRIVEILREAADTLPKHPYIKDILWQTATLFYDGQGYVYAEKLYDIYIKTYTDDANIRTALLNRAVCLASVGRSDEAVAVRRQFIRQFPEDERVAQTQYEIAEAFYNAERFDLAVQEYNHTIKDHPSSEYAVTAAYNKAWCFYRMGDSLKMVESFERFVKIFPASDKAPDAQFSIGDYYYNNKQYEKAKNAYRVVVDKFPNYPRIQEAKDLVHELDQINSYQDYAKAMSLFDAQNFAGAIPMLEEVIKKYPDADVRFAAEANIASSYSELGNKKKALEIFNRIIEKYSGMPKAQMVVFFAEQHKRWLESKENQ